MKRLIIGIVASLALATAAHADPMASRYGNTVVATNAQGQQTKVLYNEDKTFSVILPDGTTSKGTWEITAEGKICLTQTEPAPAAGQAPLCNPFAEHAVGDTWTVGEGENQMSITIVAGR